MLATWFGAGLLPIAPGTWGSAAALPLAWVLHAAGGAALLAAATVAVFAAGVWAAGVHGRRLGVDDAGEIVIDEVAGQWLTLLVVPPDFLLYALGFVLFRLADIVKPWPVSLADRRLKGGFGVMFDDVLAAVYAGVILYALNFLIGG